MWYIFSAFSTWIRISVAMRLMSIFLLWVCLLEIFLLCVYHYKICVLHSLSPQIVKTDFPYHQITLKLWYLKLSVCQTLISLIPWIPWVCWSKLEVPPTFHFVFKPLYLESLNILKLYILFIRVCYNKDWQFLVAEKFDM